MRCSVDALKASTYIEDKNSGEFCCPHHIDLKTGMWCGCSVLVVKILALYPSSTKRGMRRSADTLKAPTYIEDKNSGGLCRPHTI